MLRYHHLAAKQEAQAAAELLQQAEERLHASYALFSLAHGADEPGPWYEHAQRTSEVADATRSAWSSAAELGRL